MTEHKKGLTSWHLHLIAMALMLCDHLWGTVVPGQEWLTVLGRLAFPIFAFMIAQGYAHTKSFKKYLGRMAIFALVAEIPFNLMYATSFIWPFQQNVLWTFILALLAIRWMDKIIAKHKPVWSVLFCVLVTGLFYLLGSMLFVDYLGYGVITVLLFYFSSKAGRLEKLLQLAGLIVINCFMIKGQVYPVELFGLSINIPQQAFALFALIPIWLYNGEKGTSNKLTRAVNYWFYPVHMLVLGLIMYFD